MRASIQNFVFGKTLSDLRSVDFSAKTIMVRHFYQGVK